MQINNFSKALIAITLVSTLFYILIIPSDWRFPYINMDPKWAVASMCIFSLIFYIGIQTPRKQHQFQPPLQQPKPQQKQNVVLPNAQMAANRIYSFYKKPDSTWYIGIAKGIPMIRVETYYGANQLEFTNILEIESFQWSLNNIKQYIEEQHLTQAIK